VGEYGAAPEDLLAPLPLSVPHHSATQLAPTAQYKGPGERPAAPALRPPPADRRSDLNRYTARSTTLTRSTHLAPPCCLNPSRSALPHSSNSHLQHVLGSSIRWSTQLPARTESPPEPFTRRQRASVPLCRGRPELPCVLSHSSALPAARRAAADTNTPPAWPLAAAHRSRFTLRRHDQSIVPSLVATRVKALLRSALTPVAVGTADASCCCCWCLQLMMQPLQLPLPLLLPPNLKSRLLLCLLLLLLQPQCWCYSARFLCPHDLHQARAVLPRLLLDPESTTPNAQALLAHHPDRWPPQQLRHPASMRAP